MNCKIALLNKNNADTLYLFGQKRLKIGAITRDNYLQLHLKKINAGITLESKLQEKEQACLAMNNFWELPRETSINCTVPWSLPELKIEPSKAISKALENNPDIIALKSKILYAEKTFKSAKAERLSASFSTTVGLNQNTENFIDVYRNVKDQQSISFTLSVPILDWGDNKRNIAKAKLSKELAIEDARKQKDAIELEVLNMVNNFNIKHKQVLAANQADSISKLAYSAINKQFVFGKVSVIDLNSSYRDMQDAQNNYLKSLMDFWVQLYSIRKLCLYNFEKQVDLEVDFDKMLKLSTHSRR